MQHRISRSGPLLDEFGILREPGWDTKLSLQYRRRDVKAGALRIKEWDYYLITNSRFALALTIADNGYMGLDSISLLDFKNNHQITTSKMAALTRGKKNLPSSSEEGDTETKGKDYEISFYHGGDHRILKFKMINFWQGKPIIGEIRLENPEQDSMVIATPYKEDPKAFYYNQKIIGMPATGWVEYGGEDPIREKKYIISYDFGTFKPLPLHKKVVEKLSGRQRLMIMRDIAAGVGVLHRAGIYHRNLQPGSVFVFFDRKSDYVQAKLVGFEYAKIDGDLNTVINYLKQGRSGDSSPYFSQTMKDGLADSYLGSRISWQKEDIYSMGAIFYLILTGKEPPLTFDENAFSDIQDPDLRNLLASMLSADAGLRPDADETEQELQKYM